jgi:hypothetical protein
MQNGWPVAFGEGLIQGLPGDFKTDFGGRGKIPRPQGWHLSQFSGQVFGHSDGSIIWSSLNSAGQSR